MDTTSFSHHIAIITVPSCRGKGGIPTLVIPCSEAPKGELGELLLQHAIDGLRMLFAKSPHVSKWELARDGWFLEECAAPDSSYGRDFIRHTQASNFVMLRESDTSPLWSLRG